ncbi:FecR family protein [Peristeroidobacter soli]|uniref:FecR family protein n=1 Tax=Peristeroidobacter soli TaxID=2497877 RepID=UPI00101CCFEB|nr:FecR domain-containing protein [Peristeroidobacter soli]
MRSDNVLSFGSKTSTKRRWWKDAETDPIHLAATEWLMRMQVPDVAQEEISAWLDWMQRDARHAAAFDRIQELSVSLKAVPAPPEPDAGKLVADHYDAAVPLGDWYATRNRRRVAVGVVAAVSTAVVLAGALLHIETAKNEPTVAEQVLDTSVGENRRVTLSDGSLVVLGGSTGLAVAFSERQRVVRLDRGEAYFQVAKDSSRPFIVQAGAASVTAVGTAFNVNQREDRSIVTVTEGRVLVELAKLSTAVSPRTGVHLNAGEQATADHAGIGAPATVSDLASILSWQSGRLSFNKQSLRDAVRDVNRYASKPIRLATEEIGDIPITGTVTTSNISGWVTSVERAFGLAADETPDVVMLHVAETEHAR